MDLVLNESGISLLPRFSLGNLGYLQWLVKKHGDELLKTIEKLSAELGLSLDNAEKLQIESQRVSNTTKSYQNSEIKATPAKVEAWRMWQELGMRISEIAVSVCCFQMICL